MPVEMRILVVEDDERLCQLLGRGLRENAYAVDLAADGSEALYFASVNPYDLIILDVNLPEINGFDVCRQLRASETDVPILMLTARDSLDDRVMGLDLGADDYLVKPFEFKELLARVRALLRRRQMLLPLVIAIADLEINTMSKTVQRNGEPIDLTAKEYALLEYLAINKNRVIGREEISEHVWDESFDPFSNLIEVYVKRLRAKIDGGRMRPLIQTRRGQGYILSDE
jgi:two-component system copper resistance phosphate regulon response regulator CusR